MAEIFKPQSNSITYPDYILHLSTKELKLMIYCLGILENNYKRANAEPIPHLVTLLTTLRSV